MSKLTEIRVPDIGDFDKVDVIELLVAVGDVVAAEDSLISLESDKATLEVPAPMAGTIKEIKINVGDQVGEGDLIALIAVSETVEAVAEQAAEEQPVSNESAATPEPEPDVEPQVEVKPERPRSSPVPFETSTANLGGISHASPSIRKFARELGVDLREVKGSGRKGRITHTDVQQFVKGVMQRKGAGSTGPAESAGLGLLPWPKVDFSKFGEIEVHSMSRIKKISGANLSRNWVMIPHVTQHDEADITEMEAFRKAESEKAKKQGYKLTPLAFLIKASVAALKEFPNFNASIDESGENLILKKYFNVGVAVDTPDGLVVPVVKDCESKSLSELAKNVVDASVKARDKKLGPNDMQGGCFSISSLGGIGGTAFTPIINAPEVAILGVSRSYWKPVWDGQEFKPRLMLPISLSYDHRVIDGASAARFTSYLSYVLSDLRRLLL